MAVSSPQPRPPILVVEDEPLLRFHASSLLEDVGYAKLEASSADEAMAILAARSDVRLVFTDIHMPGSMDGLKLAGEVAGRWPAVAVVLTSGLSVLDGAELPEGSMFLAKPYDPRQLLDMVAKVLRPDARAPSPA